MVVCRVIRDASFEKTARSRRCPALSVKIDLGKVIQVKLSYRNDKDTVHNS